MKSSFEKRGMEKRRATIQQLVQLTEHLQQQRQLKPRPKFCPKLNLGSSKSGYHDQSTIRNRRIGQRRWRPEMRALQVAMGGCERVGEGEGRSGRSDGSFVLGLRRHGHGVHTQR